MFRMVFTDRPFLSILAPWHGNAFRSTSLLRHRRISILKGWLDLFSFVVNPNILLNQLSCFRWFETHQRLYGTAVIFKSNWQNWPGLKTSITSIMLFAVITNSFSCVLGTYLFSKRMRQMNYSGWLEWNNWMHIIFCAYWWIVFQNAIIKSTSV